MEKNVALFSKSFSNDSLLVPNNVTTNLNTTGGNLLKNKMVAVKIHDATTSLIQQTSGHSSLGLLCPTLTTTTTTTMNPPLIQTSMSASSLTNFNSTSNTRLLDNNNNNTSSSSSSQRGIQNSKSDNSLSFEASLIQMHRFFKEQKIYTDPNDNYKRRTVVLIRSTNQMGSNNRNKTGGRFVF